jgi:uncharacterized repeat protein (TIGR03803 family)
MNTTSHPAGDRIRPAARPSAFYPLRRSDPRPTTRHFATLIAALLLFVHLLPSSSAAVTLTVLHSFAPSPAPNRIYDNSLVQGPDGNFYGTTQQGGGVTPGYGYNGTVFKMTPDGTLTTLVAFNETSAPRGKSPLDHLAQGRDGSFYGVTEKGGHHAYVNGTVFRMTPAGALTTLVEFEALPGGAPLSPNGGLVFGSDGELYGTTHSGGAYGYGSVFKLTTDGVLTTLANFNGASAPKGSGPRGSLLAGSDGNFYGATYMGGDHGRGTIFRMTPAGAVTTLVSFNNTTAPKGAGPLGGLVQGSDGSLYGTTQAGGTDEMGTVFQVTTSGVLTTLVDFTWNTRLARGFQPNQYLAHGSDGNLYGCTREGGTYGYGTVFRITPAGVLTTLVHFQSGSGLPRHGAGRLCQASDGHFYGISEYGGANNLGAIFKLDVGLAPIRLASRRDGPNLVLTWPTAGTSGFMLQHSSAVGASPTWTASGVEIVDDGTTKSATVPLGQGEHYFRLRRP